MVAASKEFVRWSNTATEPAMFKMLKRVQQGSLLTLREERALLIIRPDEHRTADRWNVPTTVLRSLQAKRMVVAYGHSPPTWALTDDGRERRLNLYKDWCKVEMIDDDYDED